jgi:hypothetical protein
MSLLLLLALAAACGAPPARSQAPASPTSTPVVVPLTDAAGEPLLVLSGGALIDGTGAEPLPDAVVLIRGSRILAAGGRTRRSPPTPA